MILKKNNKTDECNGQKKYDLIAVSIRHMGSDTL